MNASSHDKGDETLIQDFIKWAEMRHTAICDGDVPKANIAARHMFSIDTVFKEGSLSARAKLMPLLDHPNEGVRYWAALRLLTVAPGSARAVIERIADSIGPINADARGTIRMLDSGEYKPR